MEKFVGVLNESLPPRHRSMTDFRNPDSPCSLHAEMNVCRRFPRRAFHGATMYIIRIGTDQSLRNSHPCPICRKYLIRMGIRKIYYSPGEVSE